METIGRDPVRGMPAGSERVPHQVAKNIILKRPAKAAFMRYGDLKKQK